MDEFEEELRSLSRDALRRRRLWLTGILGNALIALVLVGGPYWRGRTRALEARRAFADLCACLWDAEVAPNPGLTLPPNDLPAYADAATGTDWPGRCESRAQALAPEPVFWVFPDVRAAEDDLRRARAMMLRELADAPSAVEATTSIPMRPRLAILRVAAALGVLSREADASLDLDRPSITLRDARTAAPERVPLRAMGDAQVQMRPFEEGVELFALDARGVSWTRVAGGHVDHRRLRRPALARGWTRDPNGRPWLVWSTPDVRCGEDCTRLATGVAPLGDETAVTPPPRWVAAHPFEGARSVAVGSDAVWIVARASEGAMLRRFERSELEAVPEETSAPSLDEAPVSPRRPVFEVVLPAEGRVVVEAGRVTYTRPDGTVEEWREGAVRELGLGTVDRDGPIRVLRSDAQLRLVHDDGREAELAPPPPGRLRVVAGDAALGAVSLGDDRRLRVARCAPTCGPWQELARRVHAFDTVGLGDAILVAYVHGARTAQVLRRVDDSLGDPVRPGACFREGELLAEPTGMCGPPLLAASDDRLIVGARDGEDVLLVQSRDARTFTPLEGLR
ncbi:MAG: hypothetical protein H6721_16195 [Sandaracinus sp.]|nr:hypothetical protein [Sandaracinus sp.]MCB9633659.1 hypothetical protein [Sandaracinus sp.]